MKTNTNPLYALCPLDGRYAHHMADLQALFSEYGLIKHRVLVEIEWLKALCAHSDIPEAKSLSAENLQFLEKIVTDFSISEAEKIKTIEKKTNHDLKAVEYYLQEKFETKPDLKKLIPFIHFACTSEDINNISYALMLLKCRDTVLLPLLKELTECLKNRAKTYATLPMLAHTHGQAATPTTVGKELMNFVQRVQRQVDLFSTLPILAKCNGATGNFNAHQVAYPTINWPEFSEKFIQKFGLSYNLYTTQIEPHDGLAEYLHALSRINTIFLDLSRDCWSYISMGYFTQQLKEGEVGSSTMPHKVNPIDFENAEGNLGLANALALHLSQKLPVSRLQRDLSDSTVLRNLGVTVGYCVLAWKSLLTGLKKISPNEIKIKQDLNNHWAVLTEAIQTVLRKQGVVDAYEQLKSLSRGKEINQQNLQAFIQNLPIPAESKKDLLALTPESYVGYAEKLVKTTQNKSTQQD